MKDKQVNESKEQQSLLIKPFSKMHKGALVYYILSFVVLFFNVFLLKSDSLTTSTYRVGYQEFAFGIGWIYYIANAIGLLTVISPLLGFLQNIGTKIISVVNLVISGLLLFKTLPDAINPSGSIGLMFGKGELGIGFWLILGLHALAVLVFWFFFIRKISKKRDARHVEDDIVEEDIVEEDIYGQQ